MSGGLNGSTRRLRSSLIVMAWTLVHTGARATKSELHFIRLYFVFNYHSSELSKAVEPHLKQEDEGKFRCKTCQKLFKATAFVEKHIANKHPELIKPVEEVGICFSSWLHHIDIGQKIAFLF